jgi:hypothetical protein
MQIDEGEVLVAANTAQDDVLADLHLLDDIGYIATASAQKIYSFSRGTVQGASNLSPITILQTAHPYHTGDYVAINGVLGNTAANGWWTVTYVDADHYSLDSSTGNGAWVSGGYSYHCLLGAQRLSTDLLHVTTFAKVFRRRYDQIQSVMNQMGSGNVKFVYQLKRPNSGLTLAFVGIPSQTDRYEFRYQRIPIAFERISATVDPMIDDEQLMFYGTLYFILDMLKSSGDEVVERKAAMLLQQYQGAKAARMRQEAKRDYVPDINEGLRF